MSRSDPTSSATSGCVSLRHVVGCVACSRYSWGHVVSSISRIRGAIYLQGVQLKQSRTLTASSIVQLFDDVIDVVKRVHSYANMPNVLIFGTGSVGAVYACILSRAGAEVTCVCRSNYKAAKDNGFTVHSSILGQLHARPTVVCSVTEAMRTSRVAFDFIVTCIKATDEVTEVALPALVPAVKSGSHTVLVVVQNGLGVEEPFRAAFPSTTIISGIAYLPTTQTAPTTFSHSEVEHLHLGLYPSQPPSATTLHQPLHNFAQLVKAGNATVSVHVDVQAERWKKIVANGTLNPICALTRCRDRELIGLVDSAETMIRDVMQEIACVATSQGYGDVVTQDLVDRQYARCLARPLPGVEPSMLADVRLLRPLEVHAIIGEVVEVGRQNNIDTPRLAMLHILLTGLNHALQAEREAGNTRD